MEIRYRYCREHYTQEFRELEQMMNRGEVRRDVISTWAMVTPEYCEHPDHPKARFQTRYVPTAGIYSVYDWKQDRFLENREVVDLLNETDEKVKRAAFNSSLDEALNMGNGTYKP